MRPLVLVQALVGRRVHPDSDLQHAVESHNWPEPVVESKHKLVEIALQVFRANTVVRFQEPRIEIVENDVDHGKVLVHLDMITSDRYSIVPVAQLVQSVVPGPPVRPRLGPRLQGGP